jgi:hypothetical protein
MPKILIDVDEDALTEASALLAGHQRTGPPPAPAGGTGQGSSVPYRAVGELTKWTQLRSWGPSGSTSSTASNSAP